MAEIIEDTMQQGEQVQQGEPKPAIKKSNAIELHKALKSQGFTDANLGGDEATFAKLMQNKENATSLHKALRAQGFTDVNLGGDETQFYSLMSEKKNLGEPTGKPSAPTPSPLPLKEDKETAPKGFPLAKVNYNIISQLANTPAKKPEDWTKMAQDKVISDNTRLPKVDERVAGAMGHSSIDRAADNATERALKAKGIVTPKYSAVYNQEKQRIKNNINNGDASVVVHFGKDDKGKPTQELGVSRNIGFIESLGKNFDKAIKGNEEADQFANKMTTDQKIKYLDDKQNEKAKLDLGGYISEQNTQLGEAGKFIGENALFTGNAIVGGLAGAAIVAAAPESLGASLVGLPAVMSFVFTGQDAVNQGIFNEVTNRYNKNLAAGMDKYSAMKEAEKGGVIGGVLGGLENVALTGGGLKPFSNAAKSTLEKVAKETLTSSVNLGAVSGAKTLTEKGIQAAQGYHVTPKEVVEETAQAIAGGMTVGGALHILSAGASNLLNVPKLFKNTLVDGLSQESPEAINTVLDANEKLGNITPEVKNKIVSDIDSHREAKTKVADGLTPESQSSIAGLIQLKDKLTEEAKTKDPTQVDVYNQRIKAIDEQIKNITNTNEPLKYEVDEATGRPYQNEGDLALGDIVRTKEGKLGKIEKIEGDNVTISDPKEPSKTTEINKGEVDLGPAITGIEEKETIKQMLPITDEMVNIEREFQNNGYTIETDYDNEIQIRDKNDEQVGPEELPDNLKKMAADYEKATGKLGEFDAVAREKALTQSRQVEEVTAEEVKPQENVKPIRQLGTGANVYFETDKHRVNDDLKSGKVLLNVGSKESEVPMANIKFDNAAEAVAVAKELDRIYPKGVPNAVLIDKVVENIKKEQSLSKEQTQEGSGVGGDVESINKAREEELRKNVHTYNENIERLSLGDDMAILRDNAKEELKDQRKALQGAVDMYEKDLSEMDKKDELYDHTKQNVEYWKGELKKWDDINAEYDKKLKAVEQSLPTQKGPAEKSVEETAVSKKEFEKPTKEKPFVTKNKRQIVIINDKSGLAEVFSNEGKKVTRQTEKKALREYARSIDFTKGKTAEEKAEESGKEISSNDDFVEKSENPYELANFFVNQEPTTFNLTTTEAMIADFGVGLTTNKSFKSFSDKNYITLGIAKRYLNNTKGTPLDVMAHEMSYHYFPEGEGTEISPEDIASFMIRFPNSSNAEKLMESEDAVMAADKFEKLTGLMLNRDIANVVIDQEFQRKAEEQKAIKQIVEKEYASQAELEEEYNRLYSETNGFEPGDYKLSDGTDVTVNEDGTIKSEKYEPPTKTNYFTKESIVSKTSKGIEEKKAKPTKEAKIEEFEKKLDEKAEALKKLLIPKHLREISKKGMGIEELINGAVKIIKEANRAKISIEEAIEKAVKFMKDGWDKSWGDFDEGSVRDVLATEKGETIRGITIKENKERRAELGMPERQPNPESFEKWDNEAKKLIDNGYDMEPLIQKMERGEATTPVESSIRKIYAATIDAELRNNPTQKTLQKAKRFVKASDLASSQAGKNLASLKRNAEPMSSITDFYVSKMEANGTDTLTKEQIEEVKKSFAKFEEKISTYNEIFDKATKKIAELEAENELLKTRKEVIGGKAKEGNVYKNGKRDYVAERQQYKDKLKETYQKYIESINKLGIVSDGGVEGFALTIDMAKLIMEIVKSHVEEVGAKLSEVTKRTQEDIKEIIPGIEESDIKDVIAGKYSKEKVPLTKLQEDLRDIRVEQKLLNELDRVMSAEPKGEKQQREKNQKLTAIREELLKLKKDKKVDQYSEEAKVKRLIEANKKKQQEIEEKIKNKDFEEKPKPLSPYDNEEFKKKNPKLYQELIDSYTAKQDAIHEYEIEILKDEQARMSKFKKAQEFGSKLANTTKKIVTGIDDSSLFMQTLVGTIRRPFTGAKAFKLHIQDALSKKMYERHLAELHNSPYYDLMIKSGLDITEPQSLKAKAHEEAFAGESLDITVKIKGKEYKVLNTLLSPFERAFTSLGNNMRAIAFTEYAQKLQSEGKTFENSPESYKDIANMLNTETGRGKLNEHIQKANELVTAGIWSPRLMASRLNLLGISDLVSLIPKSGSKGYYRQLTPEMRVEAIKTLGMFVATGVAISYSFAKIFGGEVDNDPTSQSFMDIKFGDKSYNIFGGFSQYVRLVAQTIAGGVTRDGKFQEFGGRKDRGANVLHFFRGKLTPVSGVVTDMMSGMKDFSGQPVTVQSEVSKLFVPLSMQSIADNMKRDGTSALLSTTLPSFVGINVKDQRDFAGASPEKVIGDKGTEKILVEKGIKIPTIGNIKQYKVSTESGVMSPEDYTKFVPQVKANFNDGWDVINSEGTVTHHDGLNDMLNATYQTSEGEYIKGEDLPIEALQSKINSIFSDAQNQTKYELNLIDKNPKVTYKKAF